MVELGGKLLLLIRRLKLQKDIISKLIKWKIK
jgi:hypothetical protein